MPALQIVAGKKNIKAALKAALAEAQGYDDPDEPPVLPLEDMQLSDDDDDLAYDMSSPSSPSKRRSADLKHDSLREHATEPLHGAGTTTRYYMESSAPPEGAGGFSAGEFIPPVVSISVLSSSRSQQCMLSIVEHDNNSPCSGGKLLYAQQK